MVLQVPPGSLVPCFLSCCYCWHHCLGHWDSGWLCHIWGCLAYRLSQFGVGAGVTGASAMSRIVRVVGSITVVETVCFYGCLCSWRGRVTGPTALLLPGSLWPWAPLQPGGWICVCHLLCYSQILLGLWAQPPEPGGRDHRRCLHCSSGSTSSVFQSTQLQMYRYVELFSILLCWAEEHLLSNGCFTGCRLKGRDKGTVSSHYDADANPWSTDF